MKNSIDPKFVKAGEPTQARWANDMVGNARHSTEFMKQGAYVREPKPNAFAPIYTNHVGTSGMPEYEGAVPWVFKVQPAYVTELIEDKNLTHSVWVEDISLQEYPEIWARTGYCLCVTFQSDSEEHGMITGYDAGRLCKLNWVSGVEINDVNESISKEATGYVPWNDDFEVITSDGFTDPDGRDGSHYIPVLACSGKEEGGECVGVSFIQYHASNILWQPDRRWNERDGYNVGDGLQVLQVADNDVNNHQAQGQSFYHRTITGQESGYDMVRNPDKCAMVLEYAAETTPGDEATATLITGYNVLDDIDGSLTIKSGTTELGKIDWTDGMMDTDADVVVDLANLNKNRDGDTGDIILSEGGTPTTLISADNGIVDAITNTTIYVREYKVCESGTVVTKKFLCLD